MEIVLTGLEQRQSISQIAVPDDVAKQLSKSATLKSISEIDKNLRPVIEDRIRLFKEEFPEPAKLFGGIDTEEMEKDTLAYIGKNSGKYYLVLNTRYWSDAFDLTVLLIESASSDDTATYHVDTAEGTIDHELAHILDNWILANQAEGEHLGSDNPAWRTAGAKKLTRYAKEDPTEAFAEAFAMRQVYGIDAVKDPSLKLSLTDAIAFCGSTMLKSWDENDHPRDNQGKFSDGGGVSLEDASNFSKMSEEGRIASFVKTKPGDFPYNAFLVENMMAQGKVENSTIPINRLSAFQSSAISSKVEEIVKHGSKGPITVVKKDGRIYIHDGYHRVAAAIVRGDKSIATHIVDLD